MTQAPVTVFDFMTRGQIKEFHEVFGRYIDWCAAQGLPQAASEPTDALGAARYVFTPPLDAAIDSAMAERPAEGGSNG